MSSLLSAPIGVFDSGIGGLTVLQILLTRFPHENFIYLGDSARLPYGNKSPERIRQFTEQALTYLKNQNCKAFVIACNSASSQFLENEFLGLPVYTVIVPGARAAIEKTKGLVGVLGTRATIQSGLYEKTLHEIAESKNMQITVTSMAAPLFVPLAEEGWVQDPITNLIAYRYLQPLILANVDTIILGCTHYPILKEAIQKVCGNHIQLIDCGNALSQILEQDFTSSKIEKSMKHEKLSLITTDRSDLFEDMAKKIIPAEIKYTISVGQID